MSGKQMPRITFSPLTRRWFILTRYDEKTTASGTRHLVAREKFDVTDQMQTILSKTSRAAVKRARVRVVT